MEPNRQLNDRLHALDAVRAFALLAGIFLHASMSFILPVPAADNSPSLTLGILFYVIHIFRMALFYIIAGIFARMMLQRKGTRTFLRDRSKRILVPLTLGWLVVAPPTIAAVLWGFQKMSGNSLLEENAVAGFPLLHLWFLYYLFVFYLVALGGCWLARQLSFPGAKGLEKIDLVMQLLLSRFYGPVILSIPLTLYLYFDQSWLIWFGIPTPDTGFNLKPPAMIAYGLAFLVGWFIHRQMALLNTWQNNFIPYLVFAIALTLACLLIVGIHPDLANTLASELLPWQRFTYTLFYCSAIWYWCIALTGLAMKFCSRPNRKIRYLADASYWLYLLHLPIIFLLQVWIIYWPVHWTMKITFILSITLLLGLTSYRYWVRNTLIGEYLNGRRYPPTSS